MVCTGGFQEWQSRLRTEWKATDKTGSLAQSKTTPISVAPTAVHVGCQPHGQRRRPNPLGRGSTTARTAQPSSRALKPSLQWIEKTSSRAQIQKPQRNRAFPLFQSGYSVSTTQLPDIPAWVYHSPLRCRSHSWRQ